MKQTQILMDMPVTVEIADARATADDIERVYTYFTYVDNTFSTYKKTSEISKINQGKIPRNKFSRDMDTVFRLADETKKLTGGYFNIKHNGIFDPSGLVKGWAINHAAALLKAAGYENCYVEAGGDIQTSGTNRFGTPWRIGIRNPFHSTEIIKLLYLSGEGVATSGTYERGQHVYNPKDKQPITDIVSLTVIGPNVYEADRFATAAFAMSTRGIEFIENLGGFEGYMINQEGVATYTSGFNSYTIPHYI